MAIKKRPKGAPWMPSTSAIPRWPVIAASPRPTATTARNVKSSTATRAEMPEATKQTAERSEAELLRHIREDFSYVKSYWQENHAESQKDMDCMACIPPAEFKADRSGRPCLWPDEVSQYVKQANNNLRQNKRSVKLSPRGLEAKDVDA